MISSKHKKLKIPGVITTPYGGQTRGEAQHPGVDIANQEGTEIPALADGVITSAGGTSNGMGNVVTLKDNQGNTHEYGHLRNSIVRPGQRVRRGQNIAAMGKSGNVYSKSGGDPSHIDIRISNAYGRYFNPMTYLRGK